MRFSPAIVAACAAVAAVCGCVDVDERAARRAFLHSALIDDHHDLLLRDPVEVEEKLARMAQDGFQLLRGNIGIWARDIVQPGFFPPPCGDGLTSAVLLVGDPHPENLGSVVAVDAADVALDGALVVDWNDFDAARYGPFFVDVRRLALAFGVVFADPVARDAVAHAVAAGYVDGAHADSALVLGEGRVVGAVFDALLEKAREKGDEELSLAVLSGADARPDVVVDDVAVDVVGDERAAVLAGLSAWRSANGVDADVVDVVRVHGKGVGSRPLLRYHALLDDGAQVEAKEIRDAFALPELRFAVERPFVDNVERVVFARRALEAVPTDPLLGRAPASPLALRVQREWEYQRSLRVRDFGAFSVDDVAAAARLAGRLLFHAHARAPGPEGSSRSAALTAVVDGCGDAFVDDTVAFVAAYKEVHQTDLELLRALLDEEGPRLGFVP